MAIDPRLSSGPQFTPIPIPQQSTALLDGVQAVGAALNNAAEIKRRSNEQVLAADREIAVRQQQEREANEASNGQVAVLEALGSAREKLQASRDDPATTLDSHRQVTADTAETLRQTMLSAFPTDRVRRQFAPQIERDVQTLVAGEDGWQRGQQAKMQGHAGDSVINLATSTIYANPSPTTFEAEHKRVLTFLDTVPMDQATRAKVLREVDAKTLRAMSDGLIAQGRFADARTLAETPQFGAIFGSDGVKLTMAQADRSEAEQNAAAKAQVAATKKAAGDHLDALSATIEQGGIVSEGDLRTAAAAAQASGVEQAKIIKFQGLGVSQAINQQFGPAADPDGSKTRAALLQLNDVAASRPLTSDESIRYDRLLKLSGTRRESDASALRPLSGKSASGDGEVLSQIDKKAVPDRFDTAEKVHPGLGYFGLVEGPSRAMALQGRYELRANPDLIKVNSPTGKRVDQFTPEFRRHLSLPIINGLGEEAVKGYQGVAEGIYATLLKGSGKTGWQPELFTRAANIALGARQGSDGQWRGGMGQVNDRHVMLPDWATAKDMQVYFARTEFSGAKYRDGRPATKDDVIANFTPVLSDGGEVGAPATYVFIGPDGKPLYGEHGIYKKIVVKKGS
jgi:hypothetical protein